MLGADDSVLELQSKRAYSIGDPRNTQNIPVLLNMLGTLGNVSPGKGFNQSNIWQRRRYLANMIINPTANHLFFGLAYCLLRFHVGACL